MNIRKRNLASITPLLLVILVDAMAFAMLAPVLAPALAHPEKQGLMAGASVEVRQAVYGLVLGVFPFVMVFMAPVLGDLSDRVGRKKVLSVCLAGAVVCNLLTGLSVAMGWLWVLFIARVIGGATAASQATSQAAVVDISLPADKPFNLSMTLFASSAGFVVGPALGGFLSDSNMGGWFGGEVPFYAIAALSAGTLILLTLFFKDTGMPSVHPEHTRLDPLRGLKEFIASWKDRKIAGLSLVFFLMQMAWGCYFSFVSVFLLERHRFSSQQVAAYMSFMGVGFCIAYGVVLPLVNRYMKAQERICLLGLLLTAVTILASVIPDDPRAMWIFALPVSISICLSYGAIITMFSDAAETGKQGWILGMTASIIAIAWGAVSVIAGIIEAFTTNGAMTLSVLLFLGSSIALLAYGRLTNATRGLE